MVTAIREKYSDFHAIPNQPNDTSKAYKVNDHVGQVGFITSMTEHFCGSCNRLRITADGNLKVSIFTLCASLSQSILLSIPFIEIGLFVWQQRSVIKGRHSKQLFKR